MSLQPDWLPNLQSNFAIKYICFLTAMNEQKSIKKKL